MQIKKNQGKITFYIVGANFGKNLHLAVSSRIIQFFSTLRESIFVDVGFFSFIFFFRC